MAKKSKKVNTTKVDILGGVSVKDKYAEWLAFPSLIRKLGQEQQAQLGLDVSEIDELLMIPTKVKFAEVVSLPRSTLYLYEQDK